MRMVMTILGIALMGIAVVDASQVPSNGVAIGVLSPRETDLQPAIALDPVMFACFFVGLALVVLAVATARGSRN